MKVVVRPYREREHAHSHAPETVNLPEVPRADDIVWLPEQQRFSRIRGQAVFAMHGVVYVEGVGLHRDDEGWLLRSFMGVGASR